MNARLLLVTLTTTACCAFAQDPAAAPATPVAPATTTPATPPATPPTPPKRSLIKFNPPKETETGKRLDGDGGSRDLHGKLPNWLYTLTPTSGKGLTTQAQPSLFTFQSEGVPSLEYRVTISEPSNPKPLFIYAASSSAKGIHRVDLSQFDITLKPGVTYEWTVALRPNPKKRSDDLIARGTIKRIEPSAELTEKLKSAAAADYPAIYAEAGLWYDALAAISDQIAANPKDKELVEMRDSLLQQVELKQAVSGR
jgi:hypothetical protein